MWTRSVVTWATVSSEQIARQNTFGPPRSFRNASSYPGQDRPVSGFPGVTSRPFKTPPLARALIAGAPESRRPEPALSGGQERAARVMGLLVSLRLRAIRRLGSPLHGTPWPVIQYGHGDLSPVWLLLGGCPLFIRRPSILSSHHLLLHDGFMHFSLPFRVTFQRSLTLLMRYRSWGVFRLRGWYPRHSDAQTRAPYSGYPLS